MAGGGEEGAVAAIATCARCWIGPATAPARYATALLLPFAVALKLGID